MLWLPTNDQEIVVNGLSNRNVLIPISNGHFHLLISNSWSLLLVLPSGHSSILVFASGLSSYPDKKKEYSAWLFREYKY